jgi:hypothetical protein
LTVLPLQQRTGVGGKPAPEPAGEPGKERLTDQRAFAADDPAAHAGLAAKGDEALDVGDRIAPARLRAGHALEFDVDLLRGEVGARRAVDEAAGDIGREQPAVFVDRARRSGDAQHHGKRIGLALDPGIGIDPDDHLGDRDRIGRQVICAVGKDRIALGHRRAGPARAFAERNQAHLAAAHHRKTGCRGRCLSGGCRGQRSANPRSTGDLVAWRAGAPVKRVRSGARPNRRLARGIQRCAQLFVFRLVGRQYAFGIGGNGPALAPACTLRSGQLLFELVGALGPGGERAHVVVHRHHLRFGLRAPLLLGHVLVDQLVDRDAFGGLPDLGIARLAAIVEDIERASHQRCGTGRAEQQHLLFPGHLVGGDGIAKR